MVTAPKSARNLRRKRFEQFAFRLNNKEKPKLTTSMKSFDFERKFTSVGHKLRPSNADFVCVDL